MAFTLTSLEDVFHVGDVCLLATVLCVTVISCISNAIAGVTVVDAIVDCRAPGVNEVSYLHSDGFIVNILLCCCWSLDCYFAYTFEVDACVNTNSRSRLKLEKCFDVLTLSNLRIL